MIRSIVACIACFLAGETAGIVAIALCRAAKEPDDIDPRQIAKEPVDIDDDFDTFVCPSCDIAIMTMGNREDHHFCLNCGQRLRWED